MARTINSTRRVLRAKSHCGKGYRRSFGIPAPSISTIVTRSQTKALAQTPSKPKFGKGAKTTKRRKRLDPWYPKRKVNKNPKPRAPQPTHFTCRICISHLPSADFIRWIPPKRARYSVPLDVPLPCVPHLARNPSRRNIDPICKTCVGSFMAAQLDTLGARRVGVGCIEPGCETPWPWEMVIKYFPVSKLEAYNLASFEHWRTDAGLSTCLSPTCDSTGLLDPSAPGYPQVQCNSCTFRSCASCLTPWHLDQTCAEVSAAAMNAQMSDAEKDTLALMQSKDGKRCPNCQLVIEKDGGCPSMYCVGCKKYFNWETAASAVPGTKKALPVASGQGYWQIPGTVVCELDGLEGKVPPVDISAYNFGAFPIPMPLPDEDDMDL
ncbi:hypothetical protein BU25DRAFT_415927 [Macroventuria anomochaeta]|uniref:Uncharacterized protein n=1 Tax=Macroventuria anomochaeta TaxID=301207 RepID=A0ACB6RK59_9PLEO|nr:uncharacterized protein BU25DRAFT_415927 [Macroventuria anomochaeta]KAF2621732.1 hypothetical protein BU25DRAFT_415927 [Macroventuria anomochaeta]